ncbi:MAG: hypothetical protein ACE3JQ_02540 [Paenisporosarcina sp.]
MTEHLFIKNDLKNATREFSCIADCLNEFQKAIESGNFENALDRTLENRHSVLELQHLHMKKKNNDRLLHLARDLRMKGIRVELINRV